MKNLMAVAALTIVLMSTSSVFVRLSYNLTADPAPAQSLNSYLVKMERECLDNLRLYKKEVLSDWNEGSETNGNARAFDLRLKKHFSIICPLPMAINRIGAKAIRCLGKGVNYFPTTEKEPSRSM